MNTGPGPVYKLPTLVGYSGHDPSRHRNPAYSIRPRTDIKTYVRGPGPHYDVRNLTKSGLDNPPAYTIRGKEAWSCESKMVLSFNLRRRKFILRFYFVLCSTRTCSRTRSIFSRVVSTNES